GPDLEREPGRTGPARQEEGREGSRARARRRLHLQDRHDPVGGTTAAGNSAAPGTIGAMDWADELAASVSGPQVVNDSKTPSGTVHVGSLRGPVILDVTVRALRAHGIVTTNLYGVDDLAHIAAHPPLTPGAD